MGPLDGYGLRQPMVRIPPPISHTLPPIVRVGPDRETGKRPVGGGRHGTYVKTRPGWIGDRYPPIFTTAKPAILIGNHRNRRVKGVSGFLPHCTFALLEARGRTCCNSGRGSWGKNTGVARMKTIPNGLPAKCSRRNFRRMTGARRVRQRSCLLQARLVAPAWHQGAHSGD